ncbi:ABC transporter ATP-binding protein [Actinomadura sp. 1N219]|uniref:ABC transporter ATP-binding protein n=1 Tax=Actinomadura sp. 1N219 TaxID=3375152 RepID=UPI0037B6B0E2
MSPLLEVRDLRAGYGKVPVLQGVSLHVDAGESVALLGPNNAGKTTLLRCLSGLVTPTGGQCLLRGDDLTGLGPVGRVDSGIVQVPEGRHVFADLTVEDNLRVGASRLPRGRRAARLDRLYEQLPPLAPLRRRRAGALSGGEQQLVAVGRALMADPSVLLVDEPSLGLSPVAVDQVIDVFRALQRADTTMLFVEQSAALAMDLCTRGYVLRKGAVAHRGDARDLTDETIKRVYLS